MTKKRMRKNLGVLSAADRTWPKGFWFVDEFFGYWAVYRSRGESRRSLANDNGLYSHECMAHFAMESDARAYAAAKNKLDPVDFREPW